MLHSLGESRRGLSAALPRGVSEGVKCCTPSLHPPSLIIQFLPVNDRRESFIVWDIPHFGNVSEPYFSTRAQRFSGGFYLAC